MRSIGEAIEYNKWYVLALQFELKSEGKYIVRSYINRKFDKEIEYNNKINFDENRKVTIGDSSEH